MEDKKNQKKTGSIIAENMSITGDVIFQGTLEIKGVLEGSLHGTQAQLGRTGRLDGEISLEDLDCQGTVTGVLRTDRLILRDTAKVFGSMSAKQLQMDPGAIFDGEMNISKDNLPGVGAHHGEGHAYHMRQAAANAVVSGQEALAEGREKAEDDLGGVDSILESLSAAITGGSELIVVVSDKKEDLYSLSRNLQGMLEEKFLVMSVSEPSGSFRELLIRVAEGVGAPVSDYSDQDQVLGDLASFLKKHNLVGKQSLLLIEHGEQMYPATLERIVQRLAGQQGSEMALTQLVLFGGLELKGMVDDDARLLVREPDCVFVL